MPRLRSSNSADDPCQRVVAASSTLLQWLRLWPGLATRTALPAGLLLLANCLLLIASQAAYVTQYGGCNLALVAQATTTVFAVVQAFIKATTVLVHRAALRRMLATVQSTKFLRHAHHPANGRSAALVRLTMNAVLLAGVTFSLKVVTSPLLFQKGERALPMLTVFPFATAHSPVYELVYTWQAWINFVVINGVVIGFDYMFVALVVAASMQFRLLRTRLREGGAEGVRGCIDHHACLLGYCRDLRQAFGPTVICQFAASTVALCMSFYQIALDSNAQIVPLAIYAGGHLVQLLTYCLAGDQLINQAGRVAVAAYESDWACPRQRRALQLVMLQAQRTLRISPVAFADLTHRSFLDVIRLSFSFFTLMRKLTVTTP